MHLPQPFDPFPDVPSPSDLLSLGWNEPETALMDLASFRFTFYQNVADLWCFCNGITELEEITKFIKFIIANIVNPSFFPL